MFRWTVAATLYLGVVWSASTQAAIDEVYAPLPVEQVRDAALEWAKARPDYTAEADELLQQVWQLPATGAEPHATFDAALRTFYLVDPDVRSLVDACATMAVNPATAEFPALHTSGDAPLYSHNIKSFYARYLSMMRHYDEALMLYDEIDPAELIDPAGSLFYKAVCEHALLDREAGLATLNQLLTGTQAVPQRYRAVAELMRHDLEELKEKTLGEVARQMRDVERRLNLGEAGQRVQRQEARIIATLDEIIENSSSNKGGGGGRRRLAAGQPVWLTRE
ncbi:MAG: hypothetical protein R3B90_08360 [Planctomycetaceae bacterium]